MPNQDRSIELERLDKGQNVVGVDRFAVGRFVSTEPGADSDVTPYRLTFTKSALLTWRWEGEITEEVLAGMGPRLETHTGEFDAPRAPGVKYLRDCPTYDPENE